VEAEVTRKSFLSPKPKGKFLHLGVLQFSQDSSSSDITPVLFLKILTFPQLYKLSAAPAHIKGKFSSSSF
jgi:hypothetical protein